MTKRTPVIIQTDVCTITGTDILAVEANSDTSVLVSVQGHDRQVGDIVVFTSVEDVSVGNGINIQGTKAPITSISADGFRVSTGDTAVSASAATGGAVTITYETTTTTIIPLNNQFDGEISDLPFYLVMGSVSNQELTLQVSPSVRNTDTEFYTVSVYEGSAVTSVVGKLPVGGWPCIKIIFKGTEVNKIVFIK